MRRVGGLSFSRDFFRASVSRVAQTVVSLSCRQHCVFTLMLIELTQANLFLQKVPVKLFTRFVFVIAFCTLPFTDCLRMSDTERVSWHLQVVASIGSSFLYSQELFVCDDIEFPFVHYNHLYKNVCD